MHEGREWPLGVLWGVFAPAGVTLPLYSVAYGVLPAGFHAVGRPAELLKSGDRVQFAVVGPGMRGTLEVTVR
jgi:hypothetical protein